MFGLGSVMVKLSIFPHRGNSLLMPLSACPTFVYYMHLHVATVHFGSNVQLKLHLSSDINL